MFIPFIDIVGWQAISRRVVEWKRTIPICNELVMPSEHDPDLPFTRAEAQLEVQKWSWQA
jgi:hypothetical protein